MARKNSIIVLSGLFTLDGQLDADFKRSVDRGVELLSRGEADFIILNGGPGKYVDGTYIPSGMRSTYRDAMRDYAVSLGVPQDLTLVQNYSSDTVGEAYFVKEMHISPRNFFDNLVVTRRFHTSWAMAIYEKILGSKFSTDFEPVETEKDNDPDTLAAEKESMDRFLKRSEGIDLGDSRKIEEMLYRTYGTYNDIPEDQRLRFY